MPLFTLEDSSAGGDDTRTEYSLIPAGMYLAEVLEAEVKESFFWVDPDDHSKGKQQKVNFKFGITDPAYAGRFIWGETPTTFNNNEKCKLRRWVEEIFGVDELAPGFQFELTDLIAEPVNVIVTHRSWNDKTTGEKKTAAQVDSVTRYTGTTEENLDDAF